MLQLTLETIRYIRSDAAKREEKARRKAEAKARAKLRKLSPDTFDRLVVHAARILKKGDPTKFAFEASCRHGMRRSLVLEGWRWADADNAAAEVVAKALGHIGAVRPRWIEGQPEVAANFSVERYYCARCGSLIDEEDRGKRRFCSKLCSNADGKERAAKSGEQQSLAEYLASLALKREQRLIRRMIKCESCGRLHLAANPGVRFCSKRCEGQARKVNEPSPCAICGTVFEQYSRVKKHKTRYCSEECTAIAKTMPREKPPRPQRVCEGCGSGFTVQYPSSTKRFCSPSCSSSRPRNRTGFACVAIEGGR